VGRQDRSTPRGFLAQSTLLDVLARVQRSAGVAKRPNGTRQYLRVCGAARADPQRPGVGLAPRPQALPMPATTISAWVLLGFVYSAWFCLSTASLRAPQASSFASLALSVFLLLIPSPQSRHSPPGAGRMCGRHGAGAEAGLEPEPAPATGRAAPEHCCRGGRSSGYWVPHLTFQVFF
jgi:hypothetical protein